MDTPDIVAELNRRPEEVEKQRATDREQRQGEQRLVGLWKDAAGNPSAPTIRALVKELTERDAEGYGFWFQYARLKYERWEWIDSQLDAPQESGNLFRLIIARLFDDLMAGDVTAKAMRSQLAEILSADGTAGCNWKNEVVELGRVLNKWHNLKQYPHTPPVTEDELIEQCRGGVDGMSKSNVKRQVKPDGTLTTSPSSPVFVGEAAYAEYRHKDAERQLEILRRVCKALAEK